MQRLVNLIAERALIHTREIASRLPSPLISRLQGAAGRLVSRSPAALSLLYGSDKAENHYTSHYRAFLGPLRSQPLTLLEIGPVPQHRLHPQGRSGPRRRTARSADYPARTGELLNPSMIR